MIARIFDYIDHQPLKINDFVHARAEIINYSFKPLYHVSKKGLTEGGEHYFRDMYYLFNQATGTMQPPNVSGSDLSRWME